MFVEFKIGLVDAYSPVQTGNVSKEIHHGHFQIVFCQIRKTKSNLWRN